MGIKLDDGVEANGMVRHWLSTPSDGYLGSDYGSNTLELIQKPMSSGVGDNFIQKLETDVPLVAALGATDIFFEDKGNDAKYLHINLVGGKIVIDGTGEIS